jgi:hypothetical protein
MQPQNLNTETYLPYLTLGRLARGRQILKRLIKIIAKKIDLDRLRVVLHMLCSVSNEIDQVRRRTYRCLAIFATTLRGMRFSHITRPHLRE